MFQFYILCGSPHWTIQKLTWLASDDPLRCWSCVMSYLLIKNEMIVTTMRDIFVCSLHIHTHEFHHWEGRLIQCNVNINQIISTKDIKKNFLVGKWFFFQLMREKNRFFFFFDYRFTSYIWWPFYIWVLMATANLTQRNNSINSILL